MSNLKQNENNNIYVGDSAEIPKMELAPQKSKSSAELLKAQPAPQVSPQEKKQN